MSSAKPSKARVPRVWPPLGWEEQGQDRARLTDTGALLYHYTTTTNLQQIRESGQLWASDTRRSNDGSEFRYALDVVREVLRGHDPEGKDFIDRNDPARVTERTSGPAAFAACLSENGDDLSQWRAYCRPYGGVAIGLDWEHVLSDNRNAVLMKCVYDREQHRQIAERVLAVWPTLFYSGPRTPSEHRTALDNLGIVLVQVSSYLKHEAFAGESEWRVLQPPFGLGITGGAEPPKLRATPTGLVPYVPLRLPVSALREVVVGPSPEPDQTLNAQALASDFGDPRVQVRCSAVPHKAW